MKYVVTKAHFVPNPLQAFCDITASMKPNITNTEFDTYDEAFAYMKTDYEKHDVYGHGYVNKDSACAYAMRPEDKESFSIKWELIETE